MLIIAGTSFIPAIASGAETVPGSPTALAATPGDGRVQLTWSAPIDGGSAIADYKVHLGTHPGHPFSSVSVTNTSYLHEGLENGRTYYYMVSAVNQAGEGVTSDIVAAIPAISSVLPSAPTNLSARMMDSSVELTWSAPADTGGSQINRYMVYRGLNSTEMEYLDTLTGTSYIDDELERGERAYYSVVAVNNRGMGAASDTVDAVITGSINYPIENVLAVGLGIVVVIAVIVTIIMFRRRSAP